MVICFESVLLIFGDGLINSFHRLLCHSLVRPELHSTALSQWPAELVKKFQKVMQTYSNFFATERRVFLF